APEVNVLAGKVRELDRKLKKIETTIKVLKNKAKKDKSRGSKELNLSLKEDREVCRRLAFKSFREVYIDTETKKCDIYFTNGLVFKNFPLNKRCRADSIISTLKYMDENTVYF
ncbi:TPA: recombinase family protein, partial [Citrobacter freundii]